MDLEELKARIIVVGMDLEELKARIIVVGVALDMLVRARSGATLDRFTVEKRALALLELAIRGVA